jgi:two-component system sensor histidine kinase QseC
MKRTLMRHLLAWVLGALVVVWASFIVVGYKTGEHEADELTDGHLASVAALLAAYQGGEFRPGQTIQAPAGAMALKAHDYQQSMSVVVWDAAGRLLTRSGNAPQPPFAGEEGFATLRLGEPAQAWRVFSRWNDGRDRKLMVLVSLRERDALADDIAGQVAQPGLWLLPVIALALGLAIRRGLRPLYELSREVSELDIHKARPLATADRQEELKATAEAINLLADRYHAALTRERALANEFAHELRTPLASLALQARGLREQAEGPARRLALERLESDALRAGEVLSHLLALARASRTELDEAAQRLDLAALARELVADFAPQADERGHELAFTSPGAFPLDGHPVLLQLALRNLLENALSHTPPGTQIEVQLDPQARWLQVCDNGRQLAVAGGGASAVAAGGALGLGLGHRVVEKVAAIHGARFEALNDLAAGGHCYRITFGPAARAQA